MFPERPDDPDSGWDRRLTGLCRGSGSSPPLTPDRVYTPANFSPYNWLLGGLPMRGWLSGLLVVWTVACLLSLCQPKEKTAAVLRVLNRDTIDDRRGVGSAGRPYLCTTRLSEIVASSELVKRSKEIR